MPDPIHAVSGIDPLGPAAVAEPGAPSSTPSPGAPTSVAAVAVDTANLNHTQDLLASIATASAAVPSLDRERIAQLQQALNAGTYTANPGLIAEKITEIESLLSARTAAD